MFSSKFINIIFIYRIFFCIKYFCDIFLETQYKCRRSQFAQTQPYEHTHAHCISMSIFERLGIY